MDKSKPPCVFNSCATACAITLDLPSRLFIKNVQHQYQGVQARAPFRPSHTCIEKQAPMMRCTSKAWSCPKSRQIAKTLSSLPRCTTLQPVLRCTSFPADAVGQHRGRRRRPEHCRLAEVLQIACTQDGPLGVMHHHTERPARRHATRYTRARRPCTRWLRPRAISSTKCSTCAATCSGMAVGGTRRARCTVAG